MDQNRIKVRMGINSKTVQSRRGSHPQPMKANAPMNIAVDKIRSLVRKSFFFATVKTIPADIKMLMIRIILRVSSLSEYLLLYIHPNPTNASEPRIISIGKTRSLDLKPPFFRMIRMIPADKRIPTIWVYGWRKGIYSGNNATNDKTFCHTGISSIFLNKKNEQMPIKRER